MTIQQTKVERQSLTLALGDWTLRVYGGRDAGTLPAASPEVTLYRGEIDERKGIEIATELLTPWDADFAPTLCRALAEAGK